MKLRGCVPSSRFTISRIYTDIKSYDDTREDKKSSKNNAYTLMRTSAFVRANPSPPLFYKRLSAHHLRDRPKGEDWNDEIGNHSVAVLRAASVALALAALEWVK